MALQIALKSQFNQDLAHAVVRCDTGNHKRLKRYMHCTDKIAIRFPGNVALFSRGRGWYRLECVGHNHGAEQRLQFAIKVMRRFLIDDEKAITEALQLLVPTIVTPGLKLATFSTMHGPADYGYIGKTIEKPTVPAAPNRLQALAHKFNSKRA